jgi:hypothetical protein
MSKIISSLSKIWLKVKNLENSLFPELQASLGVFSSKEEKLVKILDFAEIEQFIYDTHKTNIAKDRVQMARAFIAKSVYNIQTTRDLIDRLHIDRTLRVLCGWRYSNDIPSEAKFSRVFKEFSEMNLAAKTHDKFISEYLSDIIFHYNASDATKIPLREKAVKQEKPEPKVKYKPGRPKKGENREPIKPKILQQQKEMKTTKEMLSLVSTECGVGIKQNSKGNREVWITKESSLKRPLFATFDKKGVKKLNENIEPFEGFIKESFLKKNLKASRILKDIISKGYKGSQYALYSYIREELKSIKEDVQGNNKKAFKSYSTNPAEQMQFV